MNEKKEEQKVLKEILAFVREIAENTRPRTIDISKIVKNTEYKKNEE